MKQYLNAAILSHAASTAVPPNPELSRRRHATAASLDEDEERNAEEEEDGGGNGDALESEC